MKTDIIENSRIELEVITCPRCNNSNSHILFKGQDYLYHIPGEYCASKCDNCGLWYQNPRPLSEQTANLYPISYSPHKNSNQNLSQPELSINRARFLKEHFSYINLLTKTNNNFFNWRSWQIFDKYQKWNAGVDLTPRYIPNGRLLEIGCANGNRLVALQQLGWQNLSGIELVASAAKQAEEKGITIQYGQVEKELESFSDNYFDVIISSMVIEHLVNPFVVFQQISKKLKPGGQFLFSTIVRDSLDAVIFKQFWAGFDFPRHMVYLTKKDIVSFLKNHFNTIKCFNQIAPVDFLRSASWKIGTNKENFIDHVILLLSDKLIGKIICTFLAFIGFSTRVSYRCKKIEEKTTSN